MPEISFEGQVQFLESMMIELKLNIERNRNHKIDTFSMARYYYSMTIELFRVDVKHKSNQIISWSQHNLPKIIFVTIRLAMTHSVGLRVWGQFVMLITCTQKYTVEGEEKTEGTYVMFI